MSETPANTTNVNQVESPSKKSSGIKSAFSFLGKKIGAATSAISTATSDATVATPKMSKLGAEQRFDLEDETIHANKQCYVYVSCSVGKEIRDKIKTQLEQAAHEFNETLGKLEEPKGSINELKKFSEQVNIKATSVQNAKVEYDKKRNAIIQLNPPLECKLSVMNTVDANGEAITKVDGKIIEIDPKKRELKVEGTGHMKTSKGIVEHKVKMSTLSSTINVSISDLCVGGATADDNNQGQCFKDNAQKGGNKKRLHKAEILEISSDMGICE